MEQHDFPNARTIDFGVPARERAQMKVANRTAGEASELQMNWTIGGGNPDPLARNRHQLQGADVLAYRNARSEPTIAFGHSRLPLRHPPPDGS
jgi:hypothetical protein